MLIASHLCSHLIAAAHRELPVKGSSQDVAQVDDASVHHRAPLAVNPHALVSLGSNYKDVLPGSAEEQTFSAPALVWLRTHLLSQYFFVSFIRRPIISLTNITFNFTVQRRHHFKSVKVLCTLQYPHRGHLGYTEINMSHFNLTAKYKLVWLYLIT